MATPNIPQLLRIFMLMSNYAAFLVIGKYPYNIQLYTIIFLPISTSIIWMNIDWQRPQFINCISLYQCLHFPMLYLFETHITSYWAEITNKSSIFLLRLRPKFNFSNAFNVFKVTECMYKYRICPVAHDECTVIWRKLDGNNLPRQIVLDMCVIISKSSYVIVIYYG